MKQGGVILDEDSSRYRALGVFGQPVHRSHIQIQAALTQRLGAKYANFFARPQWEDGSGRIRWVSTVPGPVTHWRDMSQEERNTRALDLQIMRGEIQNYLRELTVETGQASGKASGKGGGAAFAAVLEQALSTPNDGHLHFVGDQPMATFWGFTEQNGATFEPLSVVPAAVEAPAVAPAPVPPPPPPPPPAPVAEAPVRRAWWPWLLLLLALLLLLLLGWFLWNRGVTLGSLLPNLPGIGGEASPDTEGKPPEAMGLPEGEHETLDEETRRRYLSDISRLRIDSFGRVVGPDGQVIDGVTPSDLGLLDEEGPARLADPEGMGPDAEGTDPAGPEGTTPEGGEPGSEEPGSGEMGTEPLPPDQPTPDQPTPDTPPEPMADPTTPPTPPNGDGATPPDALNLPDPSSDGSAPPTPNMGFLSGKWTSEAGLTDENGARLDQSYEFDDQGRGRSVVRRADGVTCSAPAEATMDGGKLRVRESENLTCSDGNVFERSETVCEKGADGVTRCQGSNAGGQGYDVRIKRATP
jgi:hypothetical protein